MAVTPTIYGRFLESLLEGRVSTIADQMWCMLVTSAYLFNRNSHKFKSIISGEVIGSGYAAGGQRVTTSAIVYDSVNHAVNLPAGNLAWPSVTFNGAVGAVLYMNPSSLPDSAKPLVSFLDFGQTVNKNSQAFYINWAATGVIKLDVP